MRGVGAVTALALGTVQFGLAYGITNNAGQVPQAEVRAILASAAAAGVRVLDTAAAYGAAEQVLGRCTAGDDTFRVISKTLPLRAAQVDQDALATLAAGIVNSLTRLGRARIDGLLVHHADDLLVPGGQQLFELLQDQQARGRIGKIGVSVYTAEQLEALIPRYPIDIVQLPMNVLDQRLLASGWLRRLAERGIEIHVRSAFLQGILLADADRLPDRLGVLKGGVGRFQDACREAGVGRAAACLGFFKSHPEVAQVVCGVASHAQFMELAQAWNNDKTLASGDYAGLALPDHPYLSPANWPPEAA